jgi:glycine oxidase
MHPRYPLYIVPRAGNRFLIGASAIESNDLSPISVRTMLELLSAAYAVHTGFLEARITGTYVQCRPGLPDNLPTLTHAEGISRVNGLFRHGFLIAPAIASGIADLVDGTAPPADITEILETPA